MGAMLAFVYFMMGLHYMYEAVRLFMRLFA